MENKDRTAFPIHPNKYPEGDTIGLTKREYFAGLAMQGLLANSFVAKQPSENGKSLAEEITECAVVAADELLKQLEK